MTELKKTRVPKSAESILAGALKLPLADRVAMKKELDISIRAEVLDLQTRAADANKIATGGSAAAEIRS